MQQMIQLITFKIDAVPEGSATDLRSLRKYMDVYSRPPDRSVGRSELGTLQMQHWHQKPTARYLSRPSDRISVDAPKRVCASRTIASQFLVDALAARIRRRTCARIHGASGDRVPSYGNLV